MAFTEYYYYGQGKVYSRQLTAGAKWRWWGDVSALTQSIELEKAQHKESFSGNKGLARSIPVGKAMTIDATLHQLDTAALAETLFGQLTTITAGAVVGESLGTVAAGDIIKLDYGGVTALTITDSAGSPATIAAGNYTLDPRFGSIEFSAMPGSPVFPLKAGYTHSAGSYVAMLTQAQPIVLLRYEGINLAEGNAPVIVEWYRVATEPLKQLALINNDTKLSEAPISLSVLIDSTKPATGTLGQFGRIINLPAS